MANTYTYATFTADVVPAGLKRDQQMLIISAVNMGWTLAIKSDHCVLIAPEPNTHQTIHISGRQKSGPIRQLVAKVERYGNPLLVPDVEKGDSIRRFGAATVQRKRAAETKPEPVRLVTEGPMISKGGAAGGYTSDIATQREFSDGTITYHCTRCDYEGSTPRSMGGHWQRHVHEDERLRGGHMGVEVAIAKPESAYQPTEERLGSLAQALQAAMEAGLDWDDFEAASRRLALAALTWDNERRTRNEAGIREPLTDAELLAKIRSLIDNGLYASLQAQIAELTARVDEAEAESERRRQNLATLRALMDEEIESE